MKKVFLLLMAGCLVAPLSRGALVFSDDFSGTQGSGLSGQAADTGGIWDANNGTDVSISSQNSLNTSGAGRLIFNSFSAALGAGQVLTLAYDTVNEGVNPLYSGCWAGVSLYEGYVDSFTQGNERIFLGQVSQTSWGVDGGTIGGSQASGDAALLNHLVLTYAYDTGAWTFTSDTGMLSGTGTANLALNGLRVANGGTDGQGHYGDIDLDNLTVDISNIPEPATIGLVGIFGVGALFVRRRMFR
ncbi:MAG: PEP-CTERM sorting domain-containing protein [Pontiellaceae bacterium]|nr:PEP-CTERM sorting domain-containing protein [Pontiellaceae bacterium]MBN2784623.1 PEP-CTERM sorting domain-containing protein [Pontiellaceae bacterium]